MAAWGGRVSTATPPVLSSAAALLDELFEYPVGVTQSFQMLRRGTASLAPKKGAHL
ncbi:MAG: hypothetical protein LZF86_160084 [Nitrospira sp.]|nr:MAG: hypothetical protein LZF86_160084 [Nitrospira sp.]